MSESVKTMVFVGLAVAVLGAAFLTRPGRSTTAADPDQQAHGKFFPDFTDPLTATSLEITRYDETTGQLQPFKVAKVDSVWRLPSKLDYPADAEKQLGQAAATIVDLEKLGLISDLPGSHPAYGVVDPRKADAGASGVGMYVAMADKQDKVLAEFIIGKEVKDRAGLRYVRVPTQNVVYECKVDAAKLSSKFEDWIEKDLLKLNGFDIRRVVLNNYSIDEVNQRIAQGDLLDLKYDDKEAKWSLDGLAEAEEPNNTKLTDMRNALDDLRIVDVQRKPAGLSRDLRTEEGIQIDRTAMVSLASRGFLIVEGQLYSNEGEIVVQTKDGVEYMLRFGEVAVDTEQGAAATEPPPTATDPNAAADPNAPKTDAQGSNRYIFVTARFNDELLTKPVLEPVPPATTDAAAAATGAAEPTTADKKADEATESADAERKRIERENKRKEDEYQQQVTAGQKKVKDLNDRFADWYYVISDEVYRKIHLARTDAVQAKKAEAAGAAPASPTEELNQLENALPTEPSGTAAPAAPTDEPAAPTDEPAAPTDEPAAPTDEPAAPVEPPAEPPTDTAPGSADSAAPPAEAAPSEAPSAPQY